jgi:hypothetical protein
LRIDHKPLQYVQILFIGYIDMTKLIGLVCLVAICGCTANPTTSNPTVTQTLTLSSTTSSLSVSGTFYDITANTSTAFPSGGLPPSGLPCSFNFTTGKHDTVEFKVTFSSPCTFNYTLGSTGSSATTDSSGNYTSSQITF